MIKFPVKALLRCKTQALLGGIVKLGKDWAPEVYIVGQVDRNARHPEHEINGFEMWCKGGKWRYPEDKEPHKFDVVGFMNPDGSFRPLTNELT